MKNQILLVALCLMVLASCRKSELEDAPLNTDERINVKLSVTQGSNATANEVASDTSLAILVNQLTYLVYSKAGAEVSRETQLNTDPKFGQLSLTLNRGEYSLVVIGSKASFGINQYFWQNGAPPVAMNFSDAFMEYRQESGLELEKQYKTDDTFFGMRTLIINDPQPLEELEIKRIVGKLEVAVEDVDDYWVEVKNESTGYRFGDQQPQGRVGEGLFILRSSNGPISAYILQTSEELRLVIGHGSSIDEQRELYVPIQRNRRTVVRGKLLVPIINGFHIEIQDEWIPESNVVEF